MKLNKTAARKMTKTELVDLVLDQQKRLVIARDIYRQTRNTLDQIEIIMTDNATTKVGPKYIKTRRFLTKLRSFVPSAKKPAAVTVCNFTDEMEEAMIDNVDKGDWPAL